MNSCSTTPLPGCNGSCCKYCRSNEPAGVLADPDGCDPSSGSGTAYIEYAAAVHGSADADAGSSASSTIDCCTAASVHHGSDAAGCGPNARSSDFRPPSRFEADDDSACCRFHAAVDCSA